jgi:hypothetical protein
VSKTDLVVGFLFFVALGANSIVTWHRARAAERRASRVFLEEAVAHIHRKVAEDAEKRGHDQALEEIAADDFSPFRTRARTLLGRCPNCNRGCIHCARENAASAR